MRFDCLRVTGWWLNAVWATMTLPFAMSDPRSLIQGKTPQTQHIFSHQDHCPSDRDLNKSRRAFTPHWPASKHAIVNSTRKGRKKTRRAGRGKKKTRARSVVAVGVLWFKWVHSLLDKQTDRSANVTGQACGSLECQLDGRLLTTRSRLRCQEVNSKPYEKA